jgi:hypothetical protein
MKMGKLSNQFRTPRALTDLFRIGLKVPHLFPRRTNCDITF